MSHVRSEQTWWGTIPTYQLPQRQVAASGATPETPAIDPDLISRYLDSGDRLMPVAVVKRVLREGGPLFLGFKRRFLGKLRARTIPLFELAPNRLSAFESDLARMLD